MLIFGKMVIKLSVVVNCCKLLTSQIQQYVNMSLSDFIYTETCAFSSVCIAQLQSIISHEIMNSLYYIVIIMFLANSILPSRILRRLGKLSAQIRQYPVEQNEVCGNAGIRILHENDHYLLIWKTSNVAIGNVGKPLKRAASPPVTEWFQKYTGLRKSSVITSLTSDMSGIILISKSLQDYHGIQQLSNEFHCTFYILAASTRDLHHLDEIVVNSSHRYQIIDAVTSGTYGSLCLVQAKVTGLSTNIETLLQNMSGNGYSCLGQHTTRYVALTHINVPDAIVDRVLASEHRASMCAAKDTESILSQPIPAKFLKLMRREKILYERRQEIDGVHVEPQHEHCEIIGESVDGLTRTRNPSTDEPQLANKILHHFCGVKVAVVDDSLQPRKSTEIVAEVAINFLRNCSLGTPTFQSVMSNVIPGTLLDLGCGSGAMLLAALKSVPSAYGVGIDLDVKSLQLAELNADQNSEDVHCNPNNCIEASTSCEQSRAEYCRLSERCSWVAGDFGRLVGLFRDGLLRFEGFDVIVSNPPYLSAKAAAGRVTREGSHVLVGGLTGLEAYAAICKSIIACESIRRGQSLLRPGGVLIFQCPGGDGGIHKVRKLAESFGFTAVVEERDYRGVARCLVLKRNTAVKLLPHL